MKVSLEERRAHLEDCYACQLKQDKREWPALKERGRTSEARIAVYGLSLGGGVRSPGCWSQHLLVVGHGHGP